MKILQIGKSFPLVGGVEKVMFDIMLGLSEAGVDCDMLCATTKGARPGIIRFNDCGRILCVPTWFKLAATMIAPALVFRLHKIKKEYDIIHIHHPDPMACAALFFSGYKGKVVLHWHSDILKQKTLLKFYTPFQKWLIKRADVIVGTTPVYVEESPYLQAVQHKVTAIPIGVPMALPGEEIVMRIRQQYDGKKIILSVGRLVEYKGYEYLIKAAGYLDDDYVILIGGGGPLKDELQTLINKEGVSGKVKLVGFIPDEELPGYFGACDLFCLSSVWKTEAFAIVQIEAMSCGKPIVATNIKGSGVSWVNADGISGLNVEPRDEKALAGAISRILSDEGYYKQLATGASGRYKTMFTREKMVNTCLELYKNLCGVAKLASRFEN